MCLDFKGDNIVLMTRKGSDSQLWKFESDGSIKNFSNKKYIDCKANDKVGAGKGTGLKLCDESGATFQRWTQDIT